MDAYTLRIAASRVGRGIEPADRRIAAQLAHPHGGPARCRVVRVPPAGSPALPAAFGVGGIARADRAAMLGDALRALVPATVPVAVLVDATDAGTIPRGAGSLRYVARSLDGDFGAQRCAVQDVLRGMGARWALQLDDDETLDPAAIDTLRAMAGQADRQGVVSIGLPRSNLVDGRQSDLWPDIQYRLNRTHIRYRGRVHERPDPGGWRRTTIALCATIVHRLDGERVRRRSVEYEAMGDGGARPGDEEALLRPFAP